LRVWLVEECGLAHPNQRNKVLTFSKKGVLR
jgi:hypothetical protein